MVPLLPWEDEQVDPWLNNPQPTADENPPTEMDPPSQGDGLFAGSATVEPVESAPDVVGQQEAGGASPTLPADAGGTANEATRRHSLDISLLARHIGMIAGIKC